MKPAFSMITAIFVILIMAGLLALVSSLSGKLVKETTAQYRKEQAALLAKSYTEFAILAAQGSKMGVGGKPCPTTITADVDSFDGISTSKTEEGYHVEVKMQYIGLLKQGISCTKQQTEVGKTTTSNDISMTVDVYVQYHDLSVIDSGVAQAPFVTYHRRTLQKL